MEKYQLKCRNCKIIACESWKEYDLEKWFEKSLLRGSNNIAAYCRRCENGVVYIIEWNVKEKGFVIKLDKEEVALYPDIYRALDRVMDSIYSVEKIKIQVWSYVDGKYIYQKENETAEIEVDLSDNFNNFFVVNNKNGKFRFGTLDTAKKFVESGYDNKEGFEKSRI